MSLASRHTKDLARFSRLIGKPISLNACSEPLVAESLKIAERLFDGAEIDKAPNGSILVELEDGSIISFHCMQDRELGAFARKVGSSYFVCITLGLVKLIFSMSVAIWRDQRFQSGIWEFTRERSYVATDFIPPGFENLLLGESSELSNNVRDSIFFRCFEHAIGFFWLHETWHVLGGHLDIDTHNPGVLGVIDEFLHTETPNNIANESQSYGDIPYHALEIEADRWALGKIFGSLHEKNDWSSRSDLDLLAASVGCSLFPLALHVNNSLFKNLVDKRIFHPPLWFRANEILLAEEEAANRKTINSLKETRSENSPFRERQKNLINRGMLSLSLLHPIFGDWITPVVGSTRQKESLSILELARESFKVYSEDVNKNRKAPRTRVSLNEMHD